MSCLLPERPRGFVNQTEVLRAADDLIESGLGGVRQIVVSGIAHGGKTATAVELAYRLSAEHFPDGALYYEISDDPEQAASGPEILLDLLVALGTAEEDIPVRAPARRALFRRLTTGASYLFVLDGVLSDSQIRMLELGPGGSVIMMVEARAVADLARSGCEYWPLGDLDASDALQILALLVGPDRVAAEPVAARAVVELCDRLPGVLTVVASDIRRSTGSPQPIAEMVERLRDEQRRPAARVAARGLGAVYRGMPEPAQTCYRALGLRAHGGVVTVESLALVTGLSRGAAAEALIELAGLHLVRRRGVGQYRSRGIVRDHARDIDRRTVGQRRAAEECLVEFYDERIIAADLLLAPRRPWRRLLWPDLPVTARFFDDSAAARQWLRAERVAIAAAFEYAYRTERFDLVVRWCVHLWPFHEKEKDTETLLAMHRVGLRAAEQIGSRAGTSLLRIQLGFAHYWRYELDRAVTVFGEALVMADDPQLEASAQEGLGLALLERGETEQARATFHRNEALARAIGDDRRVTLAVFHRAKSEEPKAAVPILRVVAREFAEMEQDETENEAKAWYWLGRMLADLGDPAGEVELERALAVMQTRSRPFDTAQIRFTLGQLAHERGDLETAAEHFREALSLFTYVDFAEPVRRTRAALAALGRS